MKRISLFILMLLVVGAFVFLSVRIAARISHNRISARQVQKLPHLDLKPIKQASDTTDKYVILNYFSPDCDHCQYLATELLVKQDLFNDVHFCMVTAASEARTRKFIDDYHLDRLSFLSVKLDTKGSFFRNFATTVVPSFYAYDRNHFLVTSVKQSIKLESLLQKLKCREGLKADKGL